LARARGRQSPDGAAPTPQALILAPSAPDRAQCDTHSSETSSTRRVTVSNPLFGIVHETFRCPSSGGHEGGRVGPFDVGLDGPRSPEDIPVPPTLRYGLWVSRRCATHSSVDRRTVRHSLLRLMIPQVHPTTIMAGHPLLKLVIPAQVHPTVLTEMLHISWPWEYSGSWTRGVSIICKSPPTHSSMYAADSYILEEAQVHLSTPTLRITRDAMRLRSL
jgi:hypothetical protein